MSAAPTVARIREALGARGGNAKCPAHKDQHASLSINEGPDGKVLVKCHTGCSQEAVIEELRNRGLWSQPQGVTVADLAAAKGLAEAHLRENGFADDAVNGRSVIRMDYRDASHKVTCVRYRGAIERGSRKDPRFWFRKGDKQQLFGLWRLQTDQPVIVVEGETDSVALWDAGFNAIGVPGADAWNDERFARHLKDCPTIYVHVEPDSGGRKFREKFEGSRLRNQIRFFTVPGGAKDPCELRARDPDGFCTAMEAALTTATPAGMSDSPAPSGSDDEMLAGISDDELALRFSDRHADDLRYVPAWDRWLIWDGCRWAHDERRQVFDLARKFCRGVLAEHLGADLSEAQQKRIRARLGAATTIYAVIKLASSDPRHAVSVNQLDMDPWALNTPGGILDLRTGCLRPHDPGALHTKITAATPEGECPLFLSILERVQPDPEVRRYIQRHAGYGITGSCREHVLAFWHGGGRNGKGTIAHAIRRALGDYGLEIPAETLMESHHDRHLTEIAVLRGARFVVGSEIDSGRRWNESRLKRLTGGDPISARYIGKDLFEFEPTHTLLIVGNSKPGLRSVDEAIRGRMHLVEFGVTIPEAERDPTLPERLAAEYGGILAWALEGCLDWQEGGLRPPEVVRAATSAYLAGEDMLQAWLDECCERGGQVTLTAAHRSYRAWCERNGVPVLGRNTFGDQLVTRGFQRHIESRNKSVLFAGLSLSVPADPRFSE